MRSLCEEVIFQPALDHPPPNESLKADQTANAGELPCSRFGHFPPRNEVYCWQQESDADDTSPQPMCPLHPVDLFELFQCHARVKSGEFGR